MTIEILTERLVLKPLLIKDITDEYINNLNDPSINTYISSSKELQTRKTVEDYILNYPGIFWGLFRGYKHIGTMGFHETGCIGIMIFKQYQRCGYAVEALTAAKFLGYNRAGINRRNIPSLNLFRKCGFYIREYEKEVCCIHKYF